MGLIDFVKAAGQTIGLVEEEKLPPQTRPAHSPEEIRALRERRLAGGIVKTVEKLGFQVQDFSVRVDDDVALVKGRVPSQEVREKVVLVVGNTAGIARVDDRLTVETPAPAATFYTVKPGDSLSKIARDHYRDANQYMAIFEANRPMLTHPDKIYPGQVLRIPPLPASA